jgi:hypothetical protein
MTSASFLGDKAALRTQARPIVHGEQFYGLEVFWWPRARLTYRSFLLLPKLLCNMRL